MTIHFEALTERPTRAKQYNYTDLPLLPKLGVRDYSAGLSHRCGRETKELRQLLEEIKFEVMLLKADALQSKAVYPNGAKGGAELLIYVKCSQ